MGPHSSKAAPDAKIMVHTSLVFAVMAQACHQTFYNNLRGPEPLQEHLEVGYSQGEAHL